MNMIKKLLRLSREEWPILAWGLLFLALSSGSLLIYPRFIKEIIDEAVTRKDLTQLNVAALIALVVFVVQSITGALRYYYFTLAGEKTVKRLRERLFSQILGQDMTFFDQQKTGELLGRLSSDTATLQNALSVNISMLVRALVQAVGGLVMLFATSVKLTSFILIIIPPLGYMAARFGKRVKAISKEAQDALATSSGIAEESIGTVRTVKAFAQEDFEVSRYHNRLEASFELSKKKIGVIARFTNTASTIGFIAIVFIVWYGGKLVIDDEMSVGTLTSFLLYVITVAFSIGMLAGLWTDFMSAFGASGRIFEILDHRIEDKTTGQESEVEGSIEFRQVSFSYPTRKNFPVLHNMNFKIDPHETVAIVGSSGAGKSTIVQLLMRFYEVDSGEIRFNQKRAQDFSLGQIRSSIGIVPQEPVLISESLYENIRYGRLEATREEIEEAARKAYAHDFITSFPEGYQTLVGERGVQLSGGQKQRIAIARAILKDPCILILDEATSALDAESEFLVQRALDEQIGKRTTLIIAHRLSTVRKANKILVLDQGQVVQTGTHEELIKTEDGLYFKLVQRQFNNSKENS